MNKHWRPLLIVMFLLCICGCDERKIKNNGDQTNIIELEQAILVKEYELTQLRSELVSKENKIDELMSRNEVMSKELDSMRQNLNNPAFNVFEEKLIVSSSIVLNPNSLNIDQVKQLLGEPEEVEQYIDAHWSGMAMKLTYDQASFTFNKDGDQETIKWYSILSPYFMTNRGVTVGATRNEVIEAYGTSHDIYYDIGTEITIGEKQGVTFKFENEVVKEISVWLVYE